MRLEDFEEEFGREMTHAFKEISGDWEGWRNEVYVSLIEERLRRLGQSLSPWQVEMLRYWFSKPPCEGER